MSRLLNIVGQTFGRWKVIGRADNYGTNSRWLCECKCGRRKEVNGVTLRRGESLSCGCLRRELSAARELKHGHSSQGLVSGTYATWAAMIQRCINPNNPAYPNYGGRGISVCHKWMSFTSFLDDMVIRPRNKSLDRINNNGNYEPGNCRWASHKEQANNRRLRRWHKKPTN